MEMREVIGFVEHSAGQRAPHRSQELAPLTGSKPLEKRDVEDARWLWW